MLGLLKGWLGEKGTQFGMWMHLDKETYRRVHNVIIPAQGGTTQIDHILVSVFGIFVIETKTMKGWIFGDEKSPKWTQSIFGRKHTFQNPLHQNFRHVRALMEYLDLPESGFHSVVFFNGECEIKTNVPANVLDRGLIRYIQSFRYPLLSADEVDVIYYRLSQAKFNPIATGSEHVADLKRRHSGEDCPKCGKPLVLRTASKGTNAGNQFYGCSGFPRCRYTRK